MDEAKSDARAWGAVAAAGLAAGVRFARLPGSEGPSLPPLPPGLTVPLHARLAGRLVPVDGGGEGAGGGERMRVDRVSLVALDGLLPPPDRRALLAALVCEGGGGGETDPDAACLGPAPPPALWARAAADFPGGPVSWGAVPAALARVGGGGRGPASAPTTIIPAAAALGARLAALFPGCDVALLPAADMQPARAAGGGEEEGGGGGGEGEGAGPACACEAVMATAATPGDAFAFHTDADPALTSAGTPWAAAYGRYANRDPARPWLLTAVACLCPGWDPLAWGGELRVSDESGCGAGVLAAPAPGRVFLLDADALHCVTPPSPSAPGPRFALVWKLAVMVRGEGGGASFPPPPSSSSSGLSLGAALTAAGVALPPPADLGGAAAVAAAVRDMVCKRRKGGGG